MVLKDGRRAMSGNFNLNNNRILGLANAQGATDALPLAQARTLFPVLSYGTATLPSVWVPGSLFVIDVTVPLAAASGGAIGSVVTASILSSSTAYPAGFEDSPV